MVFIPSYWKADDLDSWTIFDHPADIAEEGTLGRTLDNLEEIGCVMPVAVLPVPCIEKVIEKTRRICNGHRSVTIIDSDMLDGIREKLLEAGMGRDELMMIDFHTYGGVRNIGLVHAMMNGFDRVFMMDDDECLFPGYEDVVQRHIGAEVDGVLVLGKCGCVEDENGRKVYDGQQRGWGDSWPKDRLFNAEVMAYLGQGGLIRSNLGFGGNLILDRRLFSKVPFDPFVARGEDDDYAINCRYLGEALFFDTDMSLLHLPPERTQAFWTRHRQDFIRFAYTREKLGVLGLDPMGTGSFLSHFTQPDLERKVLVSCIEAALHFNEREDVDEANGFLETARIALNIDKRELREKAELFLRLVDSWGRAMAVIGGV